MTRKGIAFAQLQLSKGAFMFEKALQNDWEDFQLKLDIEKSEFMNGINSGNDEDEDDEDNEVDDDNKEADDHEGGKNQTGNEDNTDDEVEF